MSEKKLVIDQLKLTYEGLFDLNGLYRVIDSWFYEKGYDKFETKNYEMVLPTGKDIEIELNPWKKITEYFKVTMRLRLRFMNVKNVEIEKDGKKVKINQGKIWLIIDGYLESDYENKWEKNPLLYFLRTLYDKYIFKGYFAKAEKWCVNDVYQLHGIVQRYLNLYRYEKHIQ